MRRSTKVLIGVAVVAAFAFLIFAPIIYSPTTVYGPLVYYNETSPNYPNYPNWESPSCWTFGFGVYYGQDARTVPAVNGVYEGVTTPAWTMQYSNATQFGCPPSSTSLP